MRWSVGVGWTCRMAVCILLNMAAVNNLNWSNLTNLTIVNVTEWHVEVFAHCIKLYLRLFVDYEHLIWTNIKIFKIARYILFNKQFSRSKHIFHNNKLFLKATLVEPFLNQLTLQPIAFLFRRNVRSFTKRSCLINVKQ